MCKKKIYVYEGMGLKWFQMVMVFMSTSSFNLTELVDLRFKTLSCYYYKRVRQHYHVINKSVL